MGYEYRNTKVVCRKTERDWTSNSLYEVWVVSDGGGYEYLLGDIAQEKADDIYWEEDKPRAWWEINVDGRDAFRGEFRTLAEARKVCREELTGCIKFGNHTEHLAFYGVQDAHFDTIVY